MLVSSCLLIIIILSFGSPLIPASPHPSHNAAKLNIFSTGCGDRQDISIATYYPIRYLPGSEDSLPCTPVTHIGVSCSMTRLHSDPLIIGVELKAKNCTDNGYIEVKMHVDSTFTLVSGTLSPTKDTHVQPPSKGNAADFASGISPSAALVNCAKGFVFGTAKILNRKTPIPTDCIVAHTGVPGFVHHVTIGDGFADYMTDEEVLQLPAPESRALVTAARNNIVFSNNMYNALSQAYNEAQLVVNDMRNDLLPAPRPKPIIVNFGDALIIAGILLPTIPFGAWAPLVGVVGGSMVITGTIMNEQPEQSENAYNIVSDKGLQKMQNATQATFFDIMHTAFFTARNYTAFNYFSDGDFQDFQEFSHMKEQIKQQAIAWSASKFLNFYGLTICSNPDDFKECENKSHHLLSIVPRCNDKIQNTTTDCRLGGGFDNDGGGYGYYIDNGKPKGQIVKFANYLPNGSYDDLCNNQNGWNITKKKCSLMDFQELHNLYHG